jgi:hypothetical protein
MRPSPKGKLPEKRRKNSKGKKKENWRRTYLMGQKAQKCRKRGGEKAEKSFKNKEVKTPRE